MPIVTGMSQPGGEWLYRAVDQHKCQPPPVDVGSVGDAWRCNCGKIWSVNDSQRDGKYWQQATEHQLQRLRDKGVLAPPSDHG